MVKVKVHNFRLAPRHFGGEPQLGEGHIRFGLNRVPDCVDPVKLQRAIDSPFGNGRLVGASFDFPEYAGPNGVLAERIGSAGSYSPATRPEIYYHDLKPGFYRLVINLAQNDGSTTPFHAVTNFQILPAPATARSAPAARCQAPRPPRSAEELFAGRDPGGMEGAPLRELTPPSARGALGGDVGARPGSSRPPTDDIDLEPPILHFV